MIEFVTRNLSHVFQPCAGTEPAHNHPEIIREWERPGRVGQFGRGWWLDVGGHQALLNSSLLPLSPRRQPQLCVEENTGTPEALLLPVGTTWKVGPGERGDES